jgi:hypothetical protein
MRNVGFIDFLKVQNGVLMYDINTFCAVLKGQPAIGIAGSANGVRLTDIAARTNTSVNLAEPETVVDSYLTYPEFEMLHKFDFLRSAIRTLELPDTRIEAYGLAI